jgi:glycosyltransferase involved in cell wall biosynthesis
LAGFEPIDSPGNSRPLPFGSLVNRILVRLWPFHQLALSNFVIARPIPERVKDASVSIIIPARNESGNIKAIFERTSQMGRETELIFVEGHSKDDTCEAIQHEIASHPSTPSLLLRQVGIGKADAVRLGFSKAMGDVLMILDADLTVPPEDLPRFYEALVSGKGEFINGVRLVYPMEKEAMRMLNFLGNKFFSMAFSWLLGQPIKDTLCGTKVLWKRDYEQIAANRYYFGDFDPFGDYDLIFGAAKLNLKIIDLPIRYRERTYGLTNISRWKHGLLLMRMVAFAARRIKFT